MVSKTKTEKIIALVNGLVFVYDVEDKTKINRLELRRLISGKLMIVHQATVSGWINYLLGQYFIRVNPTSEKIRTSPYRRITMPNNDTKYFINVDKCKWFLERQRRETPKTKQLTLTQTIEDFTNVVCALDCREAVPSKVSNSTL